jgi:hypothetical protein
MAFFTTSASLYLKTFFMTLFTFFERVERNILWIALFLRGIPPDNYFYLDSYDC